MNPQFTQHDQESELSLEAEQNLHGFLKLLLEIDKEKNPHLYEDN